MASFLSEISRTYPVFFFKILKQISYEYPKRKARLALVDIREDRLGRVVEKVRSLGSPNVIAILADVSKEEECKRFVDEAVKHFRRCEFCFSNT